MYRISSNAYCGYNKFQAQRILNEGEYYSPSFSIRCFPAPGTSTPGHSVPGLSSSGSSAPFSSKSGPFSFGPSKFGPYSILMY